MALHIGTSGWQYRDWRGFVALGRLADRASIDDARAVIGATLLLAAKRRTQTFEILFLAVASAIALAHPDDGPVIVMVPPSLKQKWPKDWSVFFEKCLDRNRCGHLDAALRAPGGGFHSGGPRNGRESRHCLARGH